MLFVIAAFAFVAFSLLAYASLSYAFSDERAARRALDQLSAYEAGEAAEVQPLLQPMASRILAPLGRRVASLARSLAPKEYSERLARRITYAGLEGRWTLDRVLSVKLVGSLAAVAAVFALRASGAVGGFVYIIVAVAILAAGFFGVDMFIHTRAEGRRSVIRRELPDMLDMLTISVEAGLGFDQALTKLIRNRRGALSEEFGRMLQETQAGASRQDALHHLADRTDVEELQSFVMALVQAEAFGIAISQVLRAQAAELRLRRHQRAEELAQKAPVKQVFPLILCILPATIFIVIGPAVVLIGRMFGFVSGR